MGSKEVRLPLNIPDTILLSHGVAVQWLFTAKSGDNAGKVKCKNTRMIELRAYCMSKYSLLCAAAI